MPKACALFRKPLAYILGRRKEETTRQQIQRDGLQIVKSFWYPYFNLRLFLNLRGRDDGRIPETRLF